MYFTFHVYYLYFDLNNFCILNIGTPETACYHVYNLHKPHAWPPPVLWHWRAVNFWPEPAPFFLIQHDGCLVAAHLEVLLLISKLKLTSDCALKVFNFKLLGDKKEIKKYLNTSETHFCLSFLPYSRYSRSRQRARKHLTWSSSTNPEMMSQTTVMMTSMSLPHSSRRTQMTYTAGRWS